MITKIRELRKKIWNMDIPHPTTPEYKEWHEKCQDLLKFIDDDILSVKEVNPDWGDQIWD